MRIAVVPYSPVWPEQFKFIADSLSTILLDIPVLSIEHVGSTSILGLAAKAVIDIDIIIRSEGAESILPEVIKALTRYGEYAYHGERGVKGRHAFKYMPEATDIVNLKDKGKDDDISTKANDMRGVARNVYVCIEGSLSLKNHLIVKEVLTRDDQLRNEYASVKMELASREVEDINEYVQGKNEVLQKILLAGGLEAGELMEIGLVNTFR